MTYKGSDGVFKLVTTGGSPAAAGELTEFNLNLSCESQDATALGDSWKKKEAGLKEGAGSLSGHYDPADAAQEDLAIGDKIDVEAYPTGESAGKKITGTFLVTSFELTNNLSDRVSFSAAVESDGEVVIAAAV